MEILFELLKLILAILIMFGLVAFMFFLGYSAQNTYDSFREPPHDKFIRKQKLHWQEVKHWRPPCYCIQYCISIHADPVIRVIALNKSKSQGATRPQHCSQSSGRHPGYKRIDNSILNNIFYLKNAILHKGGRAKPANCIRRQT